MIKSLLLSAVVAGSVAYAASSSSEPSKALIDLSVSDVFVDLRALCKNDRPWELLPSYETSQSNDFRYLGTVPSKGDGYLYFVGYFMNVAPVSFTVTFSDSTDVDSNTGEFLGDDLTKDADLVCARQCGSFFFVKAKIPSLYSFSVGTSHRFSPKKISVMNSFGTMSFDSFSSDLSWKDAASGSDVVSEYYSDSYVVVDSKKVSLLCVPFIDETLDFRNRNPNFIQDKERPNSAHELFYCFLDIGESSRDFSYVNRVDYVYSSYSYDRAYEYDHKLYPAVYGGTDDLWDEPRDFVTGESMDSYGDKDISYDGGPKLLSLTVAPSSSSFEDKQTIDSLFDWSIGHTELRYSFSSLVGLKDSSIDSCGGSDAFKSYLRRERSFDGGSYDYAFLIQSSVRHIVSDGSHQTTVWEWFHGTRRCVTSCNGAKDVQVFRLGFVDRFGLSFDLNAIDAPSDVTDVFVEYHAENVYVSDIPWVNPSSSDPWGDLLRSLEKNAKAIGIFLCSLIGVAGFAFIVSQASSLRFSSDVRKISKASRKGKR